MNWVDIVIALIFLKSALQGFSRGLILSAFKTVGVIVALYMGVFYREVAVDFMKNHFAMETFLSGILLTPAIVDNTALSVINVNSIIDMAMGALGFFLVFLGVQIVFLIPAYFIDGLIKISSLTPLNRVLGAFFGLARTALWFALLSAVVSPFFLAFPGNWLDKGLGNSYILNNIRFLDFITPIVVKLI
ncbi:MAG: CvpA family protein [Tepidanaerobacteraceae bacterium]|nr:CvpA family protein [Tepidanaerobacteraceae bacterium]